MFCGGVPCWIWGCAYLCPSKNFKNYSRTSVRLQITCPSSTNRWIRFTKYHRYHVKKGWACGSACRANRRLLIALPPVDSAGGHAREQILSRWEPRCCEADGGPPGIREGEWWQGNAPPPKSGWDIVCYDVDFVPPNKFASAPTDGFVAIINAEKESSQVAVAKVEAEAKAD